MKSKLSACSHPSALSRLLWHTAVLNYSSGQYYMHPSNQVIRELLGRAFLDIDYPISSFRV